MILSYQHRRVNYYNIEDNQWINIVQYYRSLLRANAIHLPSPVSFIPGTLNAGFSNKNIFKSKYAAGIIGKFVYISLRYIRISSYILKILNKVKYFSSFRKHKIFYKRIYNKKNQLIFFRKIKHILLFFKEKYLKQIKKQKRLLWNEFFQVPEFFWSFRIIKKIKSIIWKLFNKKIITRKGIKKVIYLRRKFFYLNYDRITNFIFNNINKKKIPKKQWFLLKKKKKKNKTLKRKYTSYLWFKFIKQNIKKRRKDYFLNSNNFNNYSEINNINNLNNINFQLNNNNVISNFLKINIFNNNNLLLNNITNILNSKKTNIFLKNYSYYLYFRLYYSKYKWNFKKYNKLNNFNNLKLFYKYLSNISKKKIDLNNYIKTGMIMKLYNYSTFNYSKCYIRLVGWFDKFFMDRDLNFYFVFNSLFNIKKELIKNVLNYYFKNNNLNNNFYFIYKKRNNISNLNKKSILLTKSFQFFKVKNIKYNRVLNKKDQIIKHIDNIKNIIKNKSWIRLCYYPFLYNYKYVLQEDNETHLIYKKLKKYNENYVKKNIWNQLIRYKMKQQIINNILIHNRYNKKINNEQLIRKKYFSKLKKLNFSNRILNPTIINYNLLNDDKLILNNSLNKYFRNLYGSKKLKDNVFLNLKFKNILSEKKIKKKNSIKLNKKRNYLKNINIINLNFNSKIKLYKLMLNNFLRFKNIKYLENKNNNKNIKLINLFIDETKYHNYKLKNKNYFISLWKMRKQNEFIKKNKFRVVEKRRLINKFYFMNSLINKELFLEYSKRLFSKNKIDEYERSFLKVGPLSFYHMKTQNISNINNGINLSSNIFFISNELHNSYSKSFFNLLYWITKLFIILFFFSLKEILIDQHNNVLKSQYNKKVLYSFYKQWSIKL